MKVTREQVYSAINGERAYQHKACEERGWTEHKTVGEYLLTISKLIEKATDEWYVESDENPTNTLNNVRKLAAVAVACMEDHGAPERFASLQINLEASKDAPIGEKMFFKKEEPK